MVRFQFPSPLIRIGNVRGADIMEDVRPTDRWEPDDVIPECWTRWGLSFNQGVYQGQTKDTNERAIRGHYLVAEYLDRHPKVASDWQRPGRGYFDVLKLAEEASSGT